jgi:hypothetical protein
MSWVEIYFMIQVVSIVAALGLMALYALLIFWMSR